METAVGKTRWGVSDGFPYTPRKLLASRCSEWDKGLGTSP